MDAGLQARLQEAEQAFAAAEAEMAEPEVAGDPSRYAEVAKRYFVLYEKQRAAGGIPAWRPPDVD